MKDSESHIILCNGATAPRHSKTKSILELEYDESKKTRNVKIQLNEFVTSVFHIDKRIKDLLEIAGYVYAADRKTSRGSIDSVEYQKWSRSFHFYIKVRDHKFWNQKEVKIALSEALSFLSGDLEYEFTFIDGGEDFPANLFDNESLVLDTKKDISIVLYSGGIDSLAGIIELLETTEDELCLISHQSGQPGIKKTQNKLLNKLNQQYNNRCKHYKFKCSLTGDHAVEETQRTRSFLYCTIAFAIAKAYSRDEFYVYENGVTSLNFSKRQDLINARASRTTHPKSLTLLENFFNLISDSNISIKHPYLLKTKTDVVSIIKNYKQEGLIDSSVSCSKSFQNTSLFTHCGICSQCIDRRFAMYASQCEDFDENGIYDFDFLKKSISLGPVRTSLIDYIRLAEKFSSESLDSFYIDFAPDLIEIEPYIDGDGEEEKTEKVYELCSTHSKQIEIAIERMRHKFDKPYSKLPKNSFFNIISNREYHRPEPLRFSENLCNELRVAIPIAFFSNRPKDEKDLNNFVNAILIKNRESYEREYPSIKFSLASTVPDHSFIDSNLIIECKFIRGKTSPSKVTSGIAEDLTKYPEEHFKLFVVYDPDRKIQDDIKFIEDFEKKGNCKIEIIR